MPDPTRHPVVARLIMRIVVYDERCQSSPSNVVWLWKVLVKKMPRKGGVFFATQLSSCVVVDIPSL